MNPNRRQSHMSVPPELRRLREMARRAQQARNAAAAAVVVADRERREFDRLNVSSMSSDARRRSSAGSAPSGGSASRRSRSHSRSGYRSPRAGFLPTPIRSGSPISVETATPAQLTDNIINNVNHALNMIEGMLKKAKKSPGTRRKSKSKSKSKSGSKSRKSSSRSGPPPPTAGRRKSSTHSSMINRE
jgi:hypothetical protein